MFCNRTVQAMVRGHRLRSRHTAGADSSCEAASPYSVDVRPGSSKRSLVSVRVSTTRLPQATARTHAAPKEGDEALTTYHAAGHPSLPAVRRVQRRGSSSLPPSSFEPLDRALARASHNDAKSVGQRSQCLRPRG